MARHILIPGLLSVALTSAAWLQGQQAPAAPANPCPADDPRQSSSDQTKTAKATKHNDPSASSTTDTPCVPSSRPPSAAEQFPFPGSSSAPAMPGSPQPSADAPSAGHPKSAAEEHPFPGSAPPMPGSEPSNSSSSDNGYSSSNDSSNPATGTPSDEPKPEPARTSGRRRLPKVEKLQSDEDRAEEDLKVAKFYEGKGDLNAAYLRLQDAVKSLPNESENHYALARMAQKMKKTDVAIAEYSTYLKLEPDGENVRSAKKALDQLNAK